MGRIESICRIRLFHYASRVALAAIVMVLVSFVTSCAYYLTPTQKSDRVYLAPGIEYRLPFPETFARSLQAIQFVTIRYGQQVFAFESHIQIAHNLETMIGLDLLGRRALSISWTGQDIVTDAASWLPEGFRVGNLLADLSIIYGPISTVREHLITSKASVLDDTRSRTIRLFDKDVIIISYDITGNDIWNGKVKYRNLAFGYELDIQSMVVE